MKIRFLFRTTRSRDGKYEVLGMLRVMEKRIKITEEEKLMKANEQIKELGLDDFYIVKENDCYVLYQYPCVEAARSQKLEWCVGMAQLFV